MYPAFVPSRIACSMACVIVKSSLIGIAGILVLVAPRFLAHKRTVRDAACNDDCWADSVSTVGHSLLTYLETPSK